MFIPLLLQVAGLIIGLGAVTVIDWHGFLARKSAYWTEATTRTHKVTKPLIWLGTFLLAGGLLSQAVFSGFTQLMIVKLLLLLLLLLNGLFLSFSVSPYLLHREREGNSSVLLPASWQTKITISFVFSFLGWWGEVVLFVLGLS